VKPAEESPSLPSKGTSCPIPPDLKVNGTKGEDAKRERKGEPKRKGEEPKEKKNDCGKNGLGRNGEKKNGLGKKNASKKNGEKKNGSGKKNGFTKNGEKKSGRGNKNALGKNGLKKNCREEKRTCDFVPKGSPLVPKLAAERAAAENPA